jgi:hypothetical protein
MSKTENIISVVCLVTAAAAFSYLAGYWAAEKRYKSPPNSIVYSEGGYNITIEPSTEYEYVPVPGHYY